jgi:hypothetical protein
MLCWDGVTQRWGARGWGRLENIPSPLFWRELMSLESARSLTGNDVASRSADGRIAVLRVRQKSIGFGTTYIWDRTKSHGEQVPGECAARLQPVYALASDGRRVVLVCNKGLGYMIRVWDLGLGHEIALEGTDFGIARGAPIIRSEGIALAPDSRQADADLSLERTWRQPLGPLVMHERQLSFQLRNATLNDKAQLESLIERSARELCAPDYNPTPEPWDSPGAS